MNETKKAATFFLLAIVFISGAILFLFSTLKHQQPKSTNHKSILLANLKFKYVNEKMGFEIINRFDIIDKYLPMWLSPEEDCLGNSTKIDCEIINSAFVRELYDKNFLLIQRGNLYSSSICKSVKIVEKELAFKDVDCPGKMMEFTGGGFEKIGHKWYRIYSSSGGAHHNQYAKYDIDTGKTTDYYNVAGTSCSADEVNVTAVNELTLKITSHEDPKNRILISCPDSQNETNHNCFYTIGKGFHDCKP